MLLPLTCIKNIFLKFYKDWVSLCSIIRVKSPPPVEICKIERSIHLYSSPWSRFSKTNDLRRHISSVHEGKRPYQCDKCEKSFKGQLISECLFGVFNFSKKTTKKFDEFLPKIKKSVPIKIIKAHYYSSLLLIRGYLT